MAGANKAIELAINRDLAILEDLQASFLPFTDLDYPALLNQIDGAPLGLFCRGNTGLLTSRQIAIVGSRHASRSGTETARHFAIELCQAGLTVTSGLALGIDGAAHQGALHATGNTIAVIATGIERIYPMRHRQLHQRIVEEGLVVSEFPPGTAPRRAHFPMRNRIISGLCRATVVVEAGLRSGSLITARLAAEQGREVFAIPGSIHSPVSRGCHYLLRQGAALAEAADDILLELGLGNHHVSGKPVTEPGSGIDLAPDLAQLYQLIDYAPCPLDQLIELSGLTADQVSSILIRLELAGLVSESHGGYQKLPASTGN